jgi:hypothetical protein
MGLRMRLVTAGAVCGAVTAAAFSWLVAREHLGTDEEPPESH